MGHNRLGALPRTKQWNQVVVLLRQERDAASVAAAAMDAADQGFRRAAADEGVGRVTWLLSQLPIAARDPRYPERLAALGLDIGRAPSLTELVGTFSDAVDKHMRRSGGRTDLGEMAQMAAAETLTSVLGSRTKTLFGTTPQDVQKELGALATKKQFGSLARNFFANLTRRYLTFFLSRELSNHVGGGRTFANVSEHAEFNKAIEVHCREAARIVETFSGDWFSKANWVDRKTGVTPRKARAFAWTALEKLRSELRRGAPRQR